MPRSIQHRATQGELDPKMLGRTDIDQYYGAAETMENIITLTQGGFKRRGGLEYIDENLKQLTFITPSAMTAVNGGTVANANDLTTSTVLLTTVNVGTTNPYVVAQYDLGSVQTIGVVHIIGAKVTVSTTFNEMFVQTSLNASTWFSIGDAFTFSTTEKNFSRRVELPYRYVRLAKIGGSDISTNRISIQEMNVYTHANASNVRIINFEFNTDQSYILVLTDKNIAVYLDGVFQVDIPATRITNSMLADITWAQSADTLIIFHEDMNPQIVQRQGANDYWTIADLTFDNTPYHAFTEVVQTGTAAGFGTLTPSAVSGTVTLTISSGTWGAGVPHQYVEGNGGLARILNKVSATVVNAFVEIPFYDTTAIAGASWNYLTGYEATWSSTRGWPICGTFHTGRLWIGGSKSRPTTAWASRVGIFYDFALGTSLDDEGIEITLDTDQLNRITNIYSGRNLMIFTSGAEFIVPTQLNEPITPSNVSALRQSRIGSQRGLRVSEVEGGVFYVQNGGQSVQEFIFNDTQQAYGNNIISILSGHLIQDPVDTCLRRATSIDDGALYALVRGDGEATIATIQRSQQIASFTNQTTEGSFIACGADYNDLYFAVSRYSGTYLERLNEDHFLDASSRITNGLPASSFSVPHVLDGVECRVYVDESVLANATPHSGSVEISREAEDSAEIGLWFQPTFKDLPTEFPEQKTILGKLLNIAEIVLRLYNTASIKVNGKLISFRGFGLSGGGSPLDSPPPQFTGIKRMQGFRGWDETAQVTITQDEPGPLTVLAISKNIIQSK